MTHVIFDLLAYAVAFWVMHREGATVPSPVPLTLRDEYLLFLILGFTVGAIGLSTLNNTLSLHHLVPGKSILGGLIGGIVSSEWFKRRHGIRGSTGARMVPSLSIGIAVGRIGCFVSGLDDYTYGIVTAWPWGVDFGDGVLRHPVQLYESGAMVLFFLYSVWLRRTNPERFAHSIFYVFALYYGLQRFAWELLKPYADIALGINVLGWSALGLAFYGIYYLQKDI